MQTKNRFIGSVNRSIHGLANQARGRLGRHESDASSVSKKVNEALASMRIDMDKLSKQIRAVAEKAGTEVAGKSGAVSETSKSRSGLSLAAVFAMAGLAALGWWILREEEGDVGEDDAFGNADAEEAVEELDA